MPADRPIPVVDVFAGPGGLGEGFSSLRDARGRPAFRIMLSVEMDEFAHRTLLLRSFFRQFEDGKVPSAYYEYLRGEARWKGTTVSELLREFPKEGVAAQAEAWKEELRPGIADKVDAGIRRVLGRRRSRGPWVLVGGPPCQAYSIVGRSRMLAERGRRFYADKRHTLYREYLRLISAHAPTVFIMENVKGLLSSTSLAGTRVFHRILDDLRRPPNSTLRYRLFALSKGETPAQSLFEDAEDPRLFVVEAERHGIPQNRHRVIILGVLESAMKGGSTPPHLTELDNAPKCRHAIADLPRLRSGLSQEVDSPERWAAVLQTVRRERWLTAMRSDGHAEVASVIARSIDDLRVPRAGRGGRFIEGDCKAGFSPEWFFDRRLGGVCNHESRQHRRDDLHRYLFVSSFGRAQRFSPKLRDFPLPLLPDHDNVYEALGYGMFNDRFRVQLADEPATTITAHIAKDGHYFIHPDPTQCRALTVREAARIQTFPDNYFFEGPRTEQYRQVGNAVPPLLARRIAGIVFEGVNRQWK